MFCGEFLAVDVFNVLICLSVCMYVCMYVAKINESVVGASHEDEEDIVFDEDFDDGDLEVDDVRMIWCVCVCVSCAGFECMEDVWKLLKLLVLSCKTRCYDSAAS